MPIQIEQTIFQGGRADRFAIERVPGNGNFPLAILYPEVPISHDKHAPTLEIARNARRSVWTWLYRLSDGNVRLAKFQGEEAAIALTDLPRMLTDQRPEEIFHLLR